MNGPTRNAASFSFPLAGRRTELTQLMSLIMSVTELNKLSQSGHPVQAQTLVKLFHLCMTILDKAHSLKDYRSKKKNHIFIPLNELKSLVARTRIMLANALDTDFSSATRRLKHA